MSEENKKTDLNISKTNKKRKNKREKAFSYKKAIVVTIIGISSYLGGVYAGSNGSSIVMIIDSDGFKFTEKAENTQQSNGEIVQVNGDRKNISVADIIEEIAKSVVNIRTKTKADESSYVFVENGGVGSGVIVAETKNKVFILTNSHVVSGMEEIEVAIDDYLYLKAKIAGTNKINDIGVVYIEKSKIPKDYADSYAVAVTGNSDDLRMGEEVLAIGNSLGRGKTVSSGLIGSLNRKLNMNDPKDITYIQTNASINPGSSGGGLFNYKGVLIGINTAKLSEKDVEGMGYAIPINRAMKIGEKIVKENS